MQDLLFDSGTLEKDVVYTPDWCARDMVEHFKPNGRVLEPSKGGGAFLQYLPGAEWCEIAYGAENVKAIQDARLDGQLVIRAWAMVPNAEITGG